MTGREWFRFGLFVILVALTAVAISQSKITIKVDEPPIEQAKPSS
jgi:hypothetical protein